MISPTYTLQEIKVQIENWDYEDVVSFIEILKDEMVLYSHDEKLLVLNELMQRVLWFTKEELQKRQ